MVNPGGAQLGHNKEITGKVWTGSILQIKIDMSCKFLLSCRSYP